MSEKIIKQIFVRLKIKSRAQKHNREIFFFLIGMTSLIGELATLEVITAIS